MPPLVSPSTMFGSDPLSVRLILLPVFALVTLVATQSEH